MAPPPRLNIDLVSEALSVSAGFSLDPLIDWWEGLVLRNREARNRESLSEWVRSDPCPVCGASAVHLTLVDREDVSVECMKCRNRINFGDSYGYQTFWPE